jgi:enoyl-CoA hydratase/3-hydroxyacyl-CoA dehydrogenase
LGKLIPDSRRKKEVSMKTDDIRKVAVIGAGDMGHGIAEIALLAGYEVFLRDVKKEFLDRGLERIHESLSKLLQKEKVTQQLYDRIQEELLHPCIDLSQAVKEADLIIEGVPEVVDLKKEVFREMDRQAPSHALLASNTSTIKITEIAKATGRPEKVLGLHYFNPVVLMNLVEVIRGEETSEETMQIAYDYCLNTNKVPVRVEKDTPGFVVNRVQAPSSVLIGCILDEGTAEPEEIDALMRKLGMPMGPCELMDYTGIDVGYNARQYFAENLHPDFTPAQIVKEKVKAGNLGKKTGKGFFDWSKGRPEIQLSKATDKLDPLDLTAVQINEATKLIEAGVCGIEDIDKAIVNGTGNKVGPMTIAQGQDPADLAQRLERLADRFKKEIFRPTQTIREGRYKQ